MPHPLEVINPELWAALNNDIVRISLIKFAKKNWWWLESKPEDLVQEAMMRILDPKIRGGTWAKQEESPMALIVNTIRSIASHEIEKIKDQKCKAIETMSNEKFEELAAQTGLEELSLCMARAVLCSGLTADQAAEKEGVSNELAEKAVKRILWVKETVDATHRVTAINTEPNFEDGNQENIEPESYLQHFLTTLPSAEERDIANLLYKGHKQCEIAKIIKKSDSHVSGAVKRIKQASKDYFNVESLTRK